jgi:hypothetical protein
MNAAWSVHAATDGLLIAVEETPGSLQLWRAKELNASAAAGGTAGSEMEFASWERASAELALSGGRVLAQVLCDGVDLVAMAVSPDGSTSVSVASLPEAWRVGQILRFSDLASFGAGVPPGKFATATMLGSALGALVRPEVMVVGEGDGLRGAAGMALGGGRLLAELSLGTGRVQAVTAVAPQNPVSAADYRLMGVMLLLIGGTIVIFLAKPPGPDAGAISLPPSTALADPIQRIIAGGIDVLIASVLGTGLWRLPVGTLGSAEWWGSSGSLTVIATILVILIVLGAVCESIFGRTPGKLMTGCEVVVIPRTGVAKAPEHPGLVLAIVRNIIKWIAPPIALLGLLELSRRHRADMWSSTVVVERFEEEADEG